MRVLAVVAAVAMVAIAAGVAVFYYQRPAPTDNQAGQAPADNQLTENMSMRNPADIVLRLDDYGWSENVSATCVWDNSVAAEFLPAGCQKGYYLGYGHVEKGYYLGGGVWSDLWIDFSVYSAAYRFSTAEGAKHFYESEEEKPYRDNRENLIVYSDNGTLMCVENRTMSGVLGGGIGGGSFLFVCSNDYYDPSSGDVTDYEIWFREMNFVVKFLACDSQGALTAEGVANYARIMEGRI